MNESWIEKDEKAIHDDIIAIGKEETGLTNFKNVGPLRGFLEVIARVVVFIYRTAINPIYQNATLDGATGLFLTMWGLLLGVVRKQAGKTTGHFSATAYGSGKIPAGAWIVLEGAELRYKATGEVAFQEGAEFPVPVIAEFPGNEYNIGEGMSVRITRVVSGLDAITVGENWIDSAGRDIEADEAYRERIKSRWRSQILGDIKETYRYWAGSVDGVREVQLIRTPRGPGTTDVVIAATNGLPSEALLSAVSETLYEHELLGFDVQVIGPDTTPVQVEIEFSGDADEADVELVAYSYTQSLGIGGRFSVRDLYALYEPLGLETVEIISPDRDVQAGASSIIAATVAVTKVAA